MSIRSTIAVLALSTGIAFAGTALASSAEASTVPAEHAPAGTPSVELAPAAPADGDWRQPQCLLCWIPGRPNSARPDISAQRAS